MKYTISALVGVILVLLCSAIAVTKEDPIPVITLKNMNVFYMGVDNPIAIRCDGIPDDKLKVSIVGGSMSYTDRIGEYIVRVSAGSKAIINVWVPEGDSTRIIGTEFRIKRIPDPVAYVNDVRGEGVMLKEDLQKQSGVFARMENFDFDCQFSVRSFSMSIIEEGKWKEYKTEGPAFSAEMKSAMNKVNEEEKILFHNIIVAGPDGTLRKLNTVTITVK